MQLMADKIMFSSCSESSTNTSKSSNAADTSDVDAVHVLPYGYLLKTWVREEMTNEEQKNKTVFPFLRNYAILRLIFMSCYRGGACMHLTYRQFKIADFHEHWNFIPFDKITKMVINLYIKYDSSHWEGKQISHINELVQKFLKNQKLHDSTQRSSSPALIATS
uniref:Uncharacterized protein n=1 Tax=Ditylenchus dipsaci TaxID=166011 RepID=A0A915E1W5_9BILA